MEEAIHQLNSKLETLTQNPQTLISKSSLSLLQTLIDGPDSINSLSKTLSLSSLIPPLTAAMDSAPTTISLVASKVYLSLILSPDAPVFTLFTPMALLSLLRSIRRSLKNQSPTAHPIEKRNKKKGKSQAGTSRARDEENDEESGFDIRVLFGVLERLELVLELIHLDRFLDSLKSLIQTVAELPVLGVELCGSNAYYSKLCDICSRILLNVLGPDHGDQTVTSSEVLKMLTPAIFMAKSPARTFALGFVVNRMTGMSKNSSEIKKSIVNMPKYLAVRAPEKAEPRALAVESISGIVKALDPEDQIEFTEYVVKMSMGKSSLRLLSVDLILTLMMILSDPFGMNSEQRDENYWGLRCLEALIQRCSDSVTGIRSRALMNLAQLVGFLSGNDRNRAVLKEALGFGNSNRMDELLRKRCADEKAAVRKASLLLISKLTALSGGNLDEVVLKTMGMACSDPLVSIRKASISALSEAFRKFSDGSVTREWLQSVPHLIGDNESSIQEECENLFLELVLDRVSRVGSANLGNKNMEMETETIYTEGVLGILKEICNSDVAPWVKKICSSLGKKGKLKSKIAIALQNIIRVSESVWLSHSKPIEKWTAPPGAWLLLSEVSVYLPKAVEWEFLHHHWQLLDKNALVGKVDITLQQELEDEESEKMDSDPIARAIDRVFLLQTISNVSVELPSEPAADLAHNLLKRIEEFNMDTTEVNAHVKALRTLCRRKAIYPEEADVLVMKWVNQLVTTASETLNLYMSTEENSKRNTSFLTPPSCRNSKGKKAALSKSTLLSKATTAIYTIGSLVIVCPSADLKGVVPVLHTIITSANADPKLAKLPGPVDSIKQKAPSLYIQAWLTMGKICLADGKLAKRYIPLFVQELEKSDCAALRNNIIIMMADFCVHYTALVDCYISRITKCLRDPCELVRRQTFILLSRLLQRDYVKWRGVLFLRFLLSLVDESEKIKHLADYLFGSILKVKSPLLAYNSFVEAIFVLNDCDALKGQGNSKNSKAENRLFSIRGNDEGSRSRRMHIYTSLLKQMAPEHLLATFAKVCAEVLASATDGMVNIEDSAGQSVLQDAFQILACKEIRIPSARGSSSDLGDVDEEGGDGGGAAAAAARGKVITQAVKKGLIQNTIPIFIELKRLLESKNSPLTGSLMECLRNLLKDYKNEIDEMLVADKQLQKELIYDMQKYESQKPKSGSAEGVSGTQRPNSSFQSPNERNGQKTASEKLRSNLKHAPTPPLSAMSVPKLKSLTNGRTSGDRSSAVLESLRRKCFDSDEEN